MIVYVETNFIFELAFLREEHESCETILALANSKDLDLALPAFSIGEPYEALVRRHRQRKEVHHKLTSEIQELSRSKPYQEATDRLQELTAFLLDSGEDEKQRLDETLDRVVSAAEIIPIGLDIIRLGMTYRNTFGLTAQDSIVCASVMSHLRRPIGSEALFVTKNSKDFASPSIRAELDDCRCKLFTTFTSALAYLQHQ